MSTARCPSCYSPASAVAAHYSVPGGDIAGGVASSLRPLNGYTYSKPEPLARAPENVFVFRGKKQEVLGWRNVFDLPIEYDVELCPGLLSAESPTLSCRFLPEGGPRRRFMVIGECRSQIPATRAAGRLLVRKLFFPRWGGCLQNLKNVTLTLNLRWTFAWWCSTICSFSFPQIIACFCAIFWCEV